MIQYPDCQACECEPEETAEGGGVNATSALSQLSNSGLYYTKINEVTKANRFEDVENDDGLPTEEDAAVLATVFSQAVAGRVDNKDTNNYKTLKSDTLRLPNSGSSGRQVFAYSGVKIGSKPDYSPLPFGERINFLQFKNLKQVRYIPS